ncbi:hypothetical protein N0V90_008464 [Kalmusia sp. IMI 367209]|nr:hypothetical protein N0V90_008464 [Kalmusia sp. IMI 367209]
MGSMEVYTVPALLDIVAGGSNGSRNSSDFLESLNETSNESVLDISGLNADDLFRWPNSSIGQAVQEPGMGDSSIKNFHLSYFETAHLILPMLNRERFEAAVDAGTTKAEFTALKNAVAMAGAASQADSVDAAEHYYALARSNLEQVEQRDTDEPFLTIAAVQTLILIVFYEFKKKSLARTWMTVGRCMRLTRALDLHHLDCEVEPGDSRNSILAALKILPVGDPLELEERRSTFWCAYIIDSYVSALTGCATTFNESEVSAEKK